MTPARLLPFVAICLPLAACSVTPTYTVRVVNESRTPVVAGIHNARNLVRLETLAEARVAPGAETVLGPVDAAPLDPVELRVAPPGDMGAVAERVRLSRGAWTVTVSDPERDAWEAFTVRAEKD